MNRKSTQTDTVRKHLTEHGDITALEAVNMYGIMRLAARICDLRKEGLDITSTRWTTPGGASIARYSLT